MSTNRIIVTILTVTVMFVAHSLAANAGAAVGQQSAATSSAGPSLGKWEVTGEDNVGVVWTGTLTIEKVDPDRFDTTKYFAMCLLDLQSASSENHVGAPARYDPATRVVSFETGIDRKVSYTAVLSPDGKSLTHGKWTESTRKTGQAAMTVVSTGEWSAKLPASAS